MKQAYIIRETEEFQNVLETAYEDTYTRLKYGQPVAFDLEEVEEVSLVHELLSLIRLGYINISYASDSKGRIIIVEVKVG